MENQDKTFELLTKMYSEMQEGFNGVNKRLDKVEQRLDNVEQRLDNVEQEVAEIKQVAKKNAIGIEDINRNINVIADVEINFQEQVARETQNIRCDIENRTKLLKLAIRNNQVAMDHKLDNLLNN